MSASITYTPVAPQNYQREWNVVTPSGIVPMTNLQKNQELPHQSLTYSYRLIGSDNSGGIEYLPFLSASGRKKNEHVEVLAEWSKYAIEPDSKESPSFLYRIGVGVRISFFLTIKESNVDVSSMLAITAAIKENSVDGYMSMSVMGLDSELITALVPSIPRKISLESIEAVLSNVAFIKAQVYSDKTIITPSVIGYQTLVTGATIQQALSTQSIQGIKGVVDERVKLQQQQQQQQKAQQQQLQQQRS